MSTFEASFPVLSDAEKAHFQEFGYLALNRITSPEDVAIIRETLESLFESKAGYEEGAHFNFAGLEDDPEDPGIPQIVGPRNYARILSKTEFKGNALAVARQLLGPEAYLNSDHTLVKPAIKGPATPWHQDEAFRDPRYEYKEISIWMPLQPVDVINGCMEFIPGSHLGDILPHRSPNNDPRVHAIECYEGFDPAQAIACPIPAGGCTIHSGRTLHAAGPNRSDAPRYAYVLTFAIPPIPAKTPRVLPWLEKQNTARLDRSRAWLRRGGLFIEVWRVFRNTELKDYGKMFSKLKRKALIFFSLWKNKNR